MSKELPYYVDGQRKPVHLGTYVKTLTHGHTGRVTGMHDRCPQGAAWLAGQQDQRVRKFVDDPWVSVLVHGGGSIVVPLALVETVPPFAFDNPWAWDYFAEFADTKEQSA